MMQVPDICYGIGAAKSGTTWMHSYLRNHPQCHLRQIKEIQFFNHAANPNDGLSSRYHAMMMDAMETSGRLMTSNKDIHTALIRADFLRDFLEWFEYLDFSKKTDLDYIKFMTMHASRREGVRLCGDISPQYSLLGTTDFKRMGAVSSKPRFIFLVRDPADRVWSHCRMIANTSPSNVGPEIRTPEFLVEAFLKQDIRVKSHVDEMQRYSDYRGTIKRLSSAVGEDAIHIGFYETMTEPASIKRLCDFLEIDVFPANSSLRLNVGKEKAFPKDLNAEIAMSLSEQYEFIAEIAKEPLPETWRSARENASAASIKRIV